MGLHFSAKMSTGLPTITVAHSIAHVMDRDLACYGQDVEFVGDRRGRRYPTAYTLPKETSWQWKQIKLIGNLIEVNTHYKAEGSGRALWKPVRNEGTWTTKKMPKMLQILMEWVEWLREKPRIDYEFAVEIDTIHLSG